MTIKPTIVFRQHDPKGPSLRAEIGNGFVTPSVSGGWSVTARSREKGITEWAGRSPITMDIPILFDGFMGNDSVEADCRTLYQMMDKPEGKRDEPPIIRLGGEFPVPFKNRDWVINGIAPGPEERRPRDGHRIRAFFTVTILEHVPGDVIVVRKSSPAKKHQQKSKDGKNSPSKQPRTYTVKNGDTLQKIAARLLGDQKRWHDIKELNNIRDPNNLKVGQKLKIPK